MGKRRSRVSVFVLVRLAYTFCIDLDRLFSCGKGTRCTVGIPPPPAVGAPSLPLAWDPQLFERTEENQSPSMGI
jgi:hypothetical protein